MTTQPIQTTTQLTQTINVVISPQNTTTTTMSNTIILSNILNIISQLMRIITGATAGESNVQSNV